jgi:hypothetical protein
MRYANHVLALAQPRLTDRSYISYVKTQKNPLRVQGVHNASLRSHIASGGSLIQFP